MQYSQETGDNMEGASGIASSPYMSPMYQQGGSIVLMTNPENELYKLELTLRSMSLDKEGTPKRIGEPLLNDLGVNSIVGTIQALVNQVTVMSNLDKIEVQNLMDFLADTLSKDLMMNKKKYNINSPATRDKVFFNAMATTFVTLKRAYEEGDKRFWKGSVQEIHSTVETQRKKGIFSGLNPWNK